jgi:tRNA G18 (ribose-2'-O)-methylase SpoU
MKIVLVVHNIRSTHNVGSILRTADGLGVNKVYLTGYTPYPLAKNDERMPHESAKLDRQISKTALGAQDSVDWQYQLEILDLLSTLKREGYQIVALEQTKTAVDLTKFKPQTNLALIAGNEVEGLDKMTLDQCDQHIQIPMFGQKESFNVAVATAIALYHLRNLP